MRHFLLLVVVATVLSSCYIIKAYKVKDFKLTDHERIPSVDIHPAAEPFQFIPGSTPAGLEAFLDSNLRDSKTAAFLVIRNDSILYEKYFNGFGRESRLPSFSVAKSFVATLVNLAVDEGKIQSLSDPVTKYIPELLKTDRRYANITLQHLMDMKSGLKWNEGSYGLKDDAIKLGFRPNLKKHALKVKVEKEPGGEFDYQSINTELLALALESATGQKVSQYLEEKLWKPLGMEYKATWNTDNREQEIAFAGLNATARDFAKLGRLYLNEGKWEGKQILSPKWTRAVMYPDSIIKAGRYKNQWWLSQAYYKTKDSLAAVKFKESQYPGSQVIRKDSLYWVGHHPAPHANGILNQYIYFFPHNNVIIVRLGRYWYHPSKYPTAFIYELGSRL